jgi:predicted ATP-grasp superfamily ATP-dependent carboligase
MSKVFFGLMALLTISLLSTINHPLKENNIVQLAIQTVKIQAGLSGEVEVKLVEKRESPIPDFYIVKLLAVRKDGEVPIVVYVDRSAEKVILGTLYIKGENTTLREAGEPGNSKIYPGKLEPGKTSLSY